MPFRPGSSGIDDVYYSNNVYINNVAVALHRPPGVIAGGVYVPVDGFQYEQFHAQALIDVAGPEAAFDDPDSRTAAVSESRTYPTVPVTTAPEVDSPVTDSTPGSVSSTSAVVCNTYSTPINYDQQLSPSFRIRDLSVGALFAHDIQAQNGLTVPEILCNLQGVAEKILEPLKAQYPGFRINSAFRKGSGSSQHNKGQAVDLQWPGLTPSGYTPIAYWIRDNLPFDQLIFEHGNSIWLHISFNRTGASQRNQLLTYYPRATPNYQAGLTNYYG